MKISIFILYLLTIWGCSEFYDEKPRANTEQIIESEIISGEIFLTTVNTGEVIQFEIRGIETRNDFSDVYPKRVKSYWDKEIRTGNRHMGTDRYDWVKRKGYCEVFYRDFLGEAEYNIDLSKREEWPFQITIGGTSYPLDEYYSIEGATLYANLSINRDMVAQGHDFKFVVIQDEPIKTKVGFLKFGKCEGKGRRSFKVDAPLKFKKLEGHGVKTLEISATKKIK